MKPAAWLLRPLCCARSLSQPVAINPVQQPQADLCMWERQADATCLHGASCLTCPLPLSLCTGQVPRGGAQSKCPTVRRSDDARTYFRGHLQNDCSMKAPVPATGGAGGFDVRMPTALLRWPCVCGACVDLLGRKACIGRCATLRTSPHVATSH